jgi:hypothetical protein
LGRAGRQQAISEHGTIGADLPQQSWAPPAFAGTQTAILPESRLRASNAADTPLIEPRIPIPARNEEAIPGSVSARAATRKVAGAIFF